MPLHAGAYDNLVAEASARRDLRSAADDLAVKAKAVGYGTLAGHSLMVSHAINQRLIAFDPDTMTAALTRPAATQDTRRETAEESVLAAILTQHRQSMTMLEILRPTAWTDPARHEVHEAIVTLAASGRDIDPLTVDWEISCARERNHEPAGRPVAEDAGPSYATKVAGIPVTGNPDRRANALMDAARRSARQDAQASSAEARSPARDQQQHELLERPPQATSNGHVPGQKM